MEPDEGDAFIVGDEPGWKPEEISSSCGSMGGLTLVSELLRASRKEPSGRPELNSLLATLASALSSSVEAMLRICT